MSDRRAERIGFTKSGVGFSYLPARHDDEEALVKLVGSNVEEGRASSVVIPLSEWREITKRMPQYAISPSLIEKARRGD